MQGDPHTTGYSLSGSPAPAAPAAEPLCVRVACESNDCGALLEVAIPEEVRLQAPPNLIIRCANCERLLQVALPAETYAAFAAAQRASAHEAAAAAQEQQAKEAALLAQQQHQLAQLRGLYDQLQEQARQQALLVAGGADAARAASACASPLGALGALGALAPPPAGAPSQHELLAHGPLPAHFQLQGMGAPAAPPSAAAAAAAAAAREASHVAMAAHQHAQLAQLQRQVAAMAAHQQAAFAATAPSPVAAVPPPALAIAPLGTTAGDAGAALAADAAPETGNARTPARRRRSASLEAAAPPTAAPPPAEKRPPTAYNEFVRDEYRRLRSEDPAIASREAFALAAVSGPAAAFGVHAGAGAPTPAAAHPAAPSDGLTPDAAPGGPALRGR